MVTLRAANSDDCELLFHWVNHSDSLKGKEKTKGPISLEDHTAWFSRLLDDSAYHLWIIEDRGQAIGQLRLSPQSGDLEVDIYVDAAHRKKNLAVTALALAVQEISSIYPERALIAQVKEDNLASRRLFERAGFS